MGWFNVLEWWQNQVKAWTHCRIAFVAIIEWTSFLASTRSYCYLHVGSSWPSLLYQSCIFLFVLNIYVQFSMSIRCFFNNEKFDTAVNNQFDDVNGICFSNNFRVITRICLSLHLFLYGNTIVFMIGPVVFPLFVRSRHV